MLSVGLIVTTGFLIHFFTLLTFDPRDLAFRLISAVPQLLVRSQMVLIILFAMALILPLCVIQYFAYQCYRTRGMNLSLLKLQAPILLLLVWLLSLVFMTFRAIIFAP
jgi:hypothetical protein